MGDLIGRGTGSTDREGLGNGKDGAVALKNSMVCIRESSGYPRDSTVCSAVESADVREGVE